MSRLRAFKNFNISIVKYFIIFDINNCIIVINIHNIYNYSNKYHIKLTIQSRSTQFFNIVI